MSAIDFERDPFLSQDQHESIDRFQSIADGLTDAAGDPTGLNTQVLTHLVGNLTDRYRSFKRLPSDDSAEGFTQRMQLAVTSAVQNDITQLILHNVVALGTAIHKYRDEDEETAVGFGLSEELIQRRMSSASTAILLAGRTLLYAYPQLGEDTSTWDRARNAHTRVANAKVKPPVQISDEDGLRHAKLVDRAVVYADGTSELGTEGLFTLSKSRLVNAVRITKAYRKLSKQIPGMNGGDIRSIQLIMDLFPDSAGMTLSHEEASFVIRTGNKQARYLQSAAKIDPDIASDPKAKSIVMLSDKLGHLDAARERQAFQRTVNTTAKKLKQQHG